MTRKDYVAFAALINQTIRDYDDLEAEDGATATDAIQRIARGSADVFARDNPNFDRRRFLDECTKGTNARF